MTPERWGRLEELYQAARARCLLPSEPLLERTDPDLRATVESILAQESVLEKGHAPREDGAFLDRPAWEGREKPSETPRSASGGDTCQRWRTTRALSE